MNVPATTKPKLIDALAMKYNMDPAKFYATIRATIMPANATEEQTAALLMVAHQYDLNPILKQIYAFPSKGGGITPIISIDGWCELINRQQAYDGVEFEDHLDQDGRVYAITCSMFRKDRSRPTKITEYLAECQRNTDPWRTSPNRMLRHRALVQAARLTFGLSAAFDEGHQMEDMPVEVNMEPLRQQVAPPTKRTPPPAPNNGKKGLDPKEDRGPPDLVLTRPTSKAFEKVMEQRHQDDPDLYGKKDEPVKHDPETGEIFDGEAFLTDLDTALASAKDKDELATIFADFEVQAHLHADKDRLIRAHDLLAWHDERIAKGLKT